MVTMDSRVWLVMWIFASNVTVSEDRLGFVRAGQTTATHEDLVYGY